MERWKDNRINAGKWHGCCEREECIWMEGKGENDHECISFVESAIIAQIEDLPDRQQEKALWNVIQYLHKDRADKFKVELDKLLPPWN